MDVDEFSRALGCLSAQFESLDQKLSDHVKQETEKYDQILNVVHEIKGTLSEANGARKIVVWIVGGIIAIIAAVKGVNWQ